MADIVPQLLEFPPDKQLSPKDYDKKANEFIKLLSKQQDPTWTKLHNKQNILDLLNPSTNTLPYIYALAAQTAHVGKTGAKTEELLNRAVVFLASFDPVQIRYAGDAWSSLLNWCFDIYPQLRITDCTPLTTGMLRLDPTASTFTSSHLRLVRLCLQVGAPRQALPLLDKNITGFPQFTPKAVPDEPLCEESEQSNNFINAKSGFTLHPLKSEWVLEYYLLGAHIYLGLRNYSRARLFLEYILLSPSSNSMCSALQAEAYKKWTLLGLLAQGRSYPIPRTHNAAVLKSCKSVSKAYEALADNFEKRQYRKFSAEVEVGQGVWVEDGNTRLVKEVGDALLRWRVLDMQKTFSTLPISRVAAHLNATINGTLDLLTDMLELGHLDAHITPQTSTTEAVLHFHLAPTPTSSTDPENDSLEARTKRIQSLIAALKDADRRLQLTKEYVEVQKRNKRTGGPDGDPADMMDLTYDQPIEGLADDGEGEEDIMER
jgi:COP9 signalosome complex subunit 3